MPRLQEGILVYAAEKTLIGLMTRSFTVIIKAFIHALWLILIN